MIKQADKNGDGRIDISGRNDIYVPFFNYGLVIRKTPTKFHLKLQYKKLLLAS